MADAYFFGLALAALPGLVMSPRPATEQLVSAAIGRIGDRPAVVADVGTGSGAVAIAIARSAPRVRVWATDTSLQAALLAEANVRRHGLRGRVTVRQGDLLESVPGTLDLVVANLPYLPLARAGLHAELEREPPGAVFAPGDGLDHYRRLVAASRERLTPRGALVIQLHRRVLVASGRRELDRLAAALTSGRRGGATRPRVLAGRASLPGAARRA